MSDKDARRGMSDHPHPRLLRNEVAALTAERDVDRATCEVALANLAKMRAERDRLREEIDVVKAEWEDALRAHADASGQLTSARRSIEGLRTRMLAAEAERDRLREELLGALRERDNARHGRNETDQWADVLRQQLHEAEAERDTIAAQLARAETVIEKVGAWAAEIRQPGRGHFDDLQPWPQMTALLAAVDAYQATPATTEERSND